MRNFTAVINEQKRTLAKELAAGSFIERDVFKNFRKLLSSSLVKVVTGPRRTGKSVLSAQLLKDKPFGYVNFDDEQLIGIKNEELNDILSSVYEVYGKVDFIFLDEVQNITGWELFANRLQRQGLNLIITGSNAKLLSKELATHLTGRHFSLELLPFSFAEYIRYNGIKKDAETTEEISLLKHHFNQYLQNGGFPEAIKSPDAVSYLKTLYSTILTKDILIRHRIRYERTFRDLASYVMTNFAREVSFNKLKNIFKLGSDHTAKNYLGYLEESYLIFLIERFSFKKKESLADNRKAYSIDTGLINSVSFKFREDLSHLYENLVAVELMRRKASNPKQEVYYWKNMLQEEVDFIIKEGLKIKQLLQVCYKIEDPNTRKRELRALLKASKELRCSNLMVLTEGYGAEEKINGKKIKFVPIWKWLLT